MKFQNILMTTAMVIGLSACASTPYVPTLYNPSASEIKSIALVDDAIPEKLAANELTTHTGTGQAHGGLLGALVVGAMEGVETSNRQKALKTLLEPTGFDAEAEFEAMMSEKLLAAGYADVSIMETVRKKRVHLEEFPETKQDAILDVNLTNFGIQKARTGEEWRPATGASVKLISAGEGNDVLMENLISFNSGLLNGPSDGIITIDPDADSAGYTKIKEMDADIMVKELRDMIDEVTSTIVSLLN